MTGRITLLTLMTSLFAAAWSSDRPPDQTAAPVVPDQPYQSNSVRETALRRWPITSDERIVDASHEWAPAVVSDAPIEPRSEIGNRKQLPELQAATLVACLLAGKWIEAGRLIGDDAASMRSRGAWPRLTKSPSARITSQPKSAGSHPR